MAFLLKTSIRQRKKYQEDEDFIIFNDLINDIELNFNYKINLDKITSTYKKDKVIFKEGFYQGQKVLDISFNPIRNYVNIYHENKLIFKLLYIDNYFTNLINIKYFYKENILLEENYSALLDKHQELRSRKYYFNDQVYKEVKYNMKEIPTIYRYYDVLEKINTEKNLLIFLSVLDVNIDVSKIIVLMNTNNFDHFDLEDIVNYHTPDRVNVIRQFDESEICKLNTDSHKVIISRFCKTGKKCVDSCFDEQGHFMFCNEEDNEPFIIEVPSDAYSQAIPAMEEKIRQGLIPNIDDPRDAVKFIKRGKYTYHQALMIYKSDLVESIEYDDKLEMVVSNSPICVSSVIEYAFSIWSGLSSEDALVQSAITGLKIGGKDLVKLVNKYKIKKDEISIENMRSSFIDYKKLIKKNSASFLSKTIGIENLFNVARTQFVRLLKRRIITSFISTTVVSSTDVLNFIKRRISGAQAFKNITKEAVTVTGAAAGAAGLIVFTSQLPKITNYDTMVIGIIGGLIGGTTVGYIAKLILDKIFKDDKKRMIEILEDEMYKLCKSYILNEDELNKIENEFYMIDSKFTLMQMYSTKNRKKFARNLVELKTLKTIKDRKRVLLQPLEHYNEVMLKLINE